MIVKSVDFRKNSSSYLDIFKTGLFIYPTDTIYGLGCDARSFELIENLRLLKRRDSKPFSIIAPSKSWVYENFEVSDFEKPFVESFGGLALIDSEEKPFTLLLKPKHNFLPENLAPGFDKIGVRIPSNWFSDVVSDLGFPIVTTSVNFSGESNMLGLDSLNPEIRSMVDLVIDDGVLDNSSSKILTFDSDTLIILR